MVPGNTDVLSMLWNTVAIPYFGPATVLNDFEGKIYRFASLYGTYVVIKDHGLSREVLKEHRWSKLYSGGRAWSLVQKFFGSHNLISKNLEEARGYKKELNPLFSHKAMKSHAPNLVKAAVKLVEKWKGSDREIYNDLNAFTFGNVAREYLQMTEGSVHWQEVSDAVDEAMSYMDRYLLRDPVLTIKEKISWLCCCQDELREVKKARDRLDDVVSEVTKEEYVDIAKMLFVTGKETTASQLSITLYYLAQHPEWQEKIFEDLKSQGIESPNEITIDKLKQCKKLRATLREGKRMFPAIWGQVREVMEDHSIGGYAVKKGETIVISHKGMMDAYGSEFDPQRFLEKDPPKDNILFGIGPNACLGRYFARVQMQILVATLVLESKFSLSAHCSKVEEGIILTSTIRFKEAPILKFVSR